jgi:hypothetical protein
MLAILNQPEQRENFVQRWAYGGLWVFVCAFLWAPSRDGLEAIFALAFFIPILLLLPWRKPQFHQYGGWFNLAALCYASWSCLSSLWGEPSPFFILQWLVLVSWLLGSTWVLQARPLDMEILCSWLVGIGALVSLVAITLFYRKHGFSARLEGVGIARTPTVVGQVFGLITLLATILSWRRQKAVYALLFSLAGLFSVAAVLLSQSRGPLLSLLLALLLSAWWFRPSPRVWLSQSICLAIGAFALLLMTPIEQAIVARGISYSLRDEIWLQVWHNLNGQPLSYLWGIGLSEDTTILTAVGEYHHAHNAWLDILYRTGGIGLLLALIHLVLVVGAAIRFAVARPLLVWLIYGCGCLLVDSRNLFWEIDAKWFLYWIPAALLTAQLSKTKKSIPQLPAKTN